MIEILGLKRFYGDRCVLDIERLRMEEDCLHVVVGHNGAGKSTLLRIIAGLDAHYEGTVQSTAPQNDRVFCAQRPYMFNGTVRDNVVKGLKFRRQLRDEKSVRELTARLGLAGMLSRKAKNLSAGEMQRVALGRALIVRPRLLLLDEPAANLDPHGVDAIQNEIRRQVSDGVMVVMATHFGEVAQRSGGCIHRLEEGRLTAPEIHNVFEADLLKVEQHTWARLREGLQIRCISDRAGRRRIAIPACDIVISRQRLDSSMANVIQGVICGVRRMGNQLELEIDAGILLRAVITPDSFDKLQINVGKEVFASFKASSVRVL